VSIKKAKQRFRVTVNEAGKYIVINLLTNRKMRGTFDSVEEATKEIKARVRAQREKDLKKSKNLSRPQTTGDVYTDLAIKELAEDIQIREDLEATHISSPPTKKKKKVTKKKTKKKKPLEKSLSAMVAEADEATQKKILEALTKQKEEPNGTKKKRTAKKNKRRVAKTGRK